MNDLIFEIFLGVGNAIISLIFFGYNAIHSS